MNCWRPELQKAGNQQFRLCAKAIKYLARLVGFTEKIMARGWESKSVEDQLEERERAKLESAVPVSTEAPEHRRRREALLLMQSRLRQQKAAARSDAHRQMLEQSLRAIEEELEELRKNYRLLSTDY